MARARSTSRAPRAHAHCLSCASVRSSSQIRDEVRDVLDSRERIAQVAVHGDHLYNFWQDRANPRGLWRRTSWAEYRKPQTVWETVLDIDALARDEKENWVWKNAQCLPPRGERCLISLSRGAAMRSSCASSILPNGNSSVTDSSTRSEVRG